MANRLNAPNTFAALSPPWTLSQLDANATQNQAAWNDSSLGFVNGICTDTGAANAYVVSAVNLPFGAPSSYQSGMTLFFIPANTNTTASTITVGALGSASILSPAGNALQGGEINQNVPVGLVYNTAAPTGFRIFTPVGLTISAGSISTNQTITAAGYNSISWTGSWTAAAAATITFSNVWAGTAFFLRLNNGSGASRTFTVSPTNAAGTAMTVTLFGPGGATTLSSGATVANGQNMVIMGIAQTTQIMGTGSIV